MTTLAELTKQQLYAIKVYQPLRAINSHLAERSVPLAPKVRKLRLARICDGCSLFVPPGTLMLCLSYRLALTDAKVVTVGYYFCGECVQAILEGCKTHSYKPLETRYRELGLDGRHVRRISTQKKDSDDGHDIHGGS